MNNNFSPIFGKFDLRRCNNISDFERVRDDNDIPESELDCNKLMGLKKSYDIIFYDMNTFNIIAYIRKGQDEVKYVAELAQFLKDLSPLSLKKDADFSDLELDNILDKISATGVDSLNKKEKLFLENQSKK